MQGVTVIERSTKFDDPIYAFVHHLRNEVAQAGFKFTEGDFEIWDRRSYRAKLSLQALEIFLDNVGSLLANLRSSGMSSIGAQASSAGVTEPSTPTSPNRMEDGS